MKLVERVVEYVASKARENIALDMSHLMVVVPTAQAGRNLRRHLAMKFSPRAILPPRVVQPSRLCRPENEVNLRIATETEIAACWMKWSSGKMRGALSRIQDVWRILAGGGLAIEDVVSTDYPERWKRLKEVERGFFGFLADHGLLYPTMLMRMAKNAPRQIDEEVEEVILPPMLDPPKVFHHVLAAQRSDLKVTHLQSAPDGGTDNLRDEDIFVYGDFHALAENCRPGRMCIADAELFPDMEASLLARGFELHNPEPHALLASSLGREVRNIAKACPSGGNLAAFVRAELSTRYRGKKNLNKEFIAAAEATRALLDEMSSDTVSRLALSPAEMQELFEIRLKEASYQLEPGSSDTLVTEGWLELAWSDAESLDIAGFHEGAVPESIAGHEYLPDAFRRELGLATNEDRLKRDRAILNEVVGTRERGAVKIHVARANNVGDLKKPSRLLFEVPDSALLARVRKVLDEKESIPPLPSGRKLEVAFPESVPVPKRLSPSAIADYIRCPKLYLLRRVLKMEPLKDEREFDAATFGSLVHHVLKQYADEQIHRGAQLAHEEDIRARLRIFVDDVRREYRDSDLARELQLDALEARVMEFARIQANLAQEGWRIAHAEIARSARPFKHLGLDMEIFGKIDRVDVHPEKGTRIIDYKTWGKYEKKKANNVQLPLYGLCYGDEAASLTHLVLGDAPENVQLKEMGENDREALIQDAATAISGIMSGDFDSPGEEEDAWRSAIF